MDSIRLLANQRRLEQDFRSAESFIAHGDHLAIRHFIGLLKASVPGSLLEFFIVVQGNVAELLFHIPDNFTLSGGGHGNSTLSQNLHQVLSEITASKVQSHDCVGQGVALVDGHRVGHSIPRVQKQFLWYVYWRRAKAQPGWRRSCRGSEGLKHDLGQFFPVSLGVEGGLSEEHWVFLGGYSEFIVEGVVPNLLHVVPVGDNAVFDGVLDGEDATLVLRFVPT